MTREEAFEQGEKALKQMKTKGWKLKVFRMGVSAGIFDDYFLFHLINGPITIEPSADKFICFISDDLKDQETEGEGWSTNNSHKDPNRCFEKAVAEVERYYKQVTDVVKFVKKVRGRCSSKTRR